MIHLVELDKYNTWDVMYLKTIARILSDSLDSRYMDAYRMGGDEFVIISTSTKPECFDNAVNKIKEEMKHVPYTIAIGWAKKENATISIDDLSKIAEERMYLDKAQYYKNSGLERRKI